MLFISVDAQIEIWLYDGGLINTRGYKLQDEAVYYLNKKGKTKVLNKLDVYAIIDAQDTVYVNKLDTPFAAAKSQYLSYLKGLHDGYKYNNWKIVGANFLLGTSSAIGLPLLGFSGGYVIVPNLAGTFAFGAVKPKALPGYVSEQDTMYRKGFEISARKKKVINSIEGGLTGLAVGSVILYFVTK